MFELTGKWYNINTKKAVYPKECIQEDGRMYVILMDGNRMSMDEFQNGYIQISDETFDESQNVVAKEPVNIDDILNRPIVNTKEFEPDSNDINAIFGKLPSGFPETIPVYATSTPNPSMDIIDKAFKKQGYEYTYELVTTSKYPEKIHEFLKDFTDVRDEEIVTYIIDKFLDTESIRKVAIREIKRLFNMDYDEKINQNPDVES